MTSGPRSASPVEQRQISPPPFWLATGFPFPVGVDPLRNSHCTPAHRNAVAAARHVQSVLYAMVAIGQLDVTHFLRIGCLDDPPAKYVSYLRGQSVLHEKSREHLEEGILSVANAISMSNGPEGLLSDPPGFQRWRRYRHLSEVTEEFHAPLLNPSLLCLDEGHIITAVPWPRTGSGGIRVQWAVNWVNDVDHAARSMGLLHACRCHTLQALYEQGSTGPPNEWTMFARGGVRAVP